ncbi:MAG: hypothetical protein ACT4P6_18320 [Gemmatimonadaceae bacterium]
MNPIRRIKSTIADEELMIHELVQAQAEQAQTVQPPAVRPSREELRQQIQDAIQAAQDAARDAAREVTTAQPVPPTPPFGPFPNQGPPENVIILVVVLASLAAATIIFAPLFRALGRRIERRGEQPAETQTLAPRLDRIEQAIEAMAVEVERISEGQRYVTKQMHEIRALPAPNPLAQPAMAQRVPEPARRGDPGA